LLPDGEELLSEGAVAAEDGRIVFPAERSAPSPGGGGVYAFRGTLTFRGHAGALAVQLGEPQVHLSTDGSGTVSVASRSGRTEERPVIARFAESELTESRLLVSAPRLTWSGVAMLGNVYEVGDLLDPIEIGPDRA
jgi:hypothetical protein